jgi:hypothetical protein
MNAAQCFRFFPKMSYGASRAWVNISLARSAIDVWLSGALTLKRSVDLDSVLSMAARYELKSDLLQAREQSLEDPERLFCLEGSIRPDGELTKAGFLARAGKLCAIEMSAPVSLDRLLEEVFQDYLRSVQVKMKAWKTTAGANAELASARQKPLRPLEGPKSLEVSK